MNSDWSQITSSTFSRQQAHDINYRRADNRADRVDGTGAKALRRTKMKVWIALSGRNYEGETVLSVHSSKEGASEVIAKENASNTYVDYYIVEEFEVLE